MANERMRNTAFALGLVLISLGTASCVEDFNFPAELTSNNVIDNIFGNLMVDVDSMAAVSHVPTFDGSALRIVSLPPSTCPS